jgi:hypothetical protein
MYVPSASVYFSKGFSGNSYISMFGNRYAMTCVFVCNGVCGVLFLYHFSSGSIIMVMFSSCSWAANRAQWIACCASLLLGGCATPMPFQQCWKAWP